MVSRRYRESSPSESSRRACRSYRPRHAAGTIRRPRRGATRGLRSRPRGLVAVAVATVFLVGGATAGAADAPRLQRLHHPPLSALSAWHAPHDLVLSKAHGHSESVGPKRGTPRSDPPSVSSPTSESPAGRPSPGSVSRGRGGRSPIPDSTSNGGASLGGSSADGSSALRNCLSRPSVCGYPDGSNTGVPAGTALRPSGSLTLSTPGQVVSGLDVSGSITITASNVVLKNSRIRNVRSYAAIIVRGGVRGVLISHVEVDGGKQTPSVVGITGSGFTAEAVNIHGTADGIDAGSNVVVKNSWIHDLWVAPGDHTDGIQTTGGSNLLIDHNTIIATADRANSAVILGADLGDLSNTTLRNCLLDGGTYTVYAGADPGYDSGVISIIGNRFGSHAQYGPTSFRPSPRRSIIFSGNVWDATGAPLT